METAFTELPSDTSSPLLTKTAADCSITAENIRLMAEKGFTQLQHTLGRININAGDALVAFNKQDGKDTTKLTQYFCLAITLLNMNKEGLDEIGDDIFYKLFNYVISEYNNKM
tara:strand:+ start:54129 stop:54467 length:339 start_codon:yes stop_codon:yes gene_type:complete